MALACGHAEGQSLHYVEPGVAACVAPTAPTGAAPRTVARGAAVRARLQVTCGFQQGSYTVTLNATDPHATFSPKTFLVNFGRIVGKGDFTVSFATPGAHNLSAAITSNMGSPPVVGRFVGVRTEFDVVAR